ncbi:carboxylate-amine ligase [Lichenicoccus sp.]|uniref:carboxylate-amine ligase n=1 Tax=Lichenicoccus sp. TaxID=2781899 RepID=UPI003D10E7D3
MDSRYRFGIEEEYFLADALSRGTPSSDAARAFHVAANDRLPGCGREVLQSQVEVSTSPGTDFAEAHDRLRFLRSELAAIGRERGLLVFASGTHPLAAWPEQAQSEGERYDRMVAEYGILATRNMVCALHVHVEVPDPARRAELMRRMVPYVPMFLALSVSSPFWEGRQTGLAGYRMAAYREWPRSGLPDLMDGAADYEHYLQVMTQSGAIPDASYLWWALRPSMHYPTLELRVCDSCVRVGDSVAIAALYRCVVRMLDRRSDIHARLTGASRAIASENFWRVQRDGVHASLIDEASRTMVSLKDNMETLIALLREDAAAFGCERELEAARGIVRRGTGSDRQVETYERGLRAGLENDAALHGVVDWLAAESKRPG